MIFSGRSFLSFPVGRLANVGLRGSALVAKFLLLFLLAYYLESADLALYGLLVATISYSVYGLGFDFYSFSTRELIGSKQDQWARLLRDQGIFFAVTYTIVLPALTLVFSFGLLPWSVAPWFFFLLVFEHLAQELNRLLVAMSRQLYASVVHFLRAGLWALVVAALFWQFPSVRSIEFVLGAWVSGVASACVVGSLVLLKLDSGSLKSTIDWHWIRRGVKVAFPLLLATLALRGVFTFDRYWVGSLSGDDVLAAYVLFAGVANVVMAFLDAGVFVFLYPSIIKAFKERDSESFKNGMVSLFRQTFAISLLLSVLAAVLIYPVLLLVGKEVYVEHLGILYALLVAMFLYAIGMVPHYGLYAMSEDRSIIASHVMALVVFVGLAMWLTGLFPVYGVPLALCGSFLIMLLVKGVLYAMMKKKHRWSSTKKESIGSAAV